MTKEEAIKKIQESPAEDFEVRENKRGKKCDLCRNYAYREFTVMSKHIAGCVKGLKSTGSSHITKHICVECYKRLFPEDVLG